MVKNDTHLRITFLHNLHKDIEDMINRKMESPLEKIQSIYNDELQVLRKELESKNNINQKRQKILVTKQYNLTHCQSQNHLEDESNDTNESERKWIIVPEINNTSNNQKNSQKEMNNLNIEKTKSIKKQLNDLKIKKEKNIIGLKRTFKIIVLKKI